ncbi:MAG TPA: glycosyltransferase family 39 protein [Jatrophihabitans sp.]|nr:glycosyltransferase family 39 protein [Jatrophihabitans sp.]
MTEPGPPPGAPAAAGSALAERPEPAGRFRRPGLPAGLQLAALIAITAVAVLFRFRDLGAVGFNSDEAVYTGTGASLAGNESMRALFPIFRAHPLLLQLAVSFTEHGRITDWAPRAIAASAGVAAVLATYGLGRKLYGPSAGLIAAGLLAVMPYHVVVSRQVLLDGPMALLSLLALYCVIRYAETAALSWMLATGAALGATALCKETSLILLGGLYAFFALTPTVRIRLRHVLAGLVTLLVVLIAFPLSLAASGRANTGQHYLLWQLFRRANHGLFFYFQQVPPALGWLVLAFGIGGLLWLRRENTWRERLLLCWVLVPIAFFTVWPVKGYQYLLPLAPVAAILAGRTIWRIGSTPLLRGRRLFAVGGPLLLALLVAGTLAAGSWPKLTNHGSTLAGTGGVAGGREAGRWVAGHVPADATLLTIGPSMANILQFYGERRSYALSVSPSPGGRNPAYVPIPNPDLSIRQGQFQYLVWDAYTARRTPSFARKMTDLVNRFHGIAVFTATSRTGSTSFATVVIYQVRQR